MSYQLKIAPSAQSEIKRLPGNVRQRIRRVIDDLIDEPRPGNSKQLDFELATAEPRRIKLEQWRIVYVVIESDNKLVAILAVRRRPPYQYSDLPHLLADLP